MMTREDMLRELELLPVWQLRVPLPSQTEALPIAEAMPIKVEQNTAELVATQVQEAAVALQDEALAIVELPAVASVVMPQLFTHIANDNGDWLFVLPNAALQADEERLLQNIFMAMRIKAKPAETSSNIADVINTSRPKLLIAMGEATVQSMLQSTETLSSLRGTIQQFEGVALVATYDLGHLLQALPDKAEAWKDLCLAMQTLQTLK
jgi:DNA polymerase